MMHQCEYCCWYNDRCGNCDCPTVMKDKRVKKLKMPKSTMKNLK